MKGESHAKSLKYLTPISLTYSPNSTSRTAWSVNNDGKILISNDRKFPTKTENLSARRDMSKTPNVGFFMINDMMQKGMSIT